MLKDRRISSWFTASRVRTSLIAKACLYRPLLESVQAVNGGRMVVLYNQEARGRLPWPRRPLLTVVTVVQPSSSTVGVGGA